MWSTYHGLQTIDLWSSGGLNGSRTPNQTGKPKGLVVVEGTIGSWRAENNPRPNSSGCNNHSSGVRVFKLTPTQTAQVSNPLCVSAISFRDPPF
ncbi:hypothetical protein O181_076525 [Austropuccinia psidii MF-1]|uniref:Uncharacterized protein n=1 Tax=Austropuccinia psidii MF-1 TaxID=1389203 RepID=A0A9Q3FGE4_9BASI|nr:hypothetical protein [Austropuccinia psidii MF-1]